MSGLQRLGRLWRTIRPLTPEQLIGRLRHELRRRLFHALPALLPSFLEGSGLPQPALHAPGLAASEDPDPLVLEQRTPAAGYEPLVWDWANPKLPKLARYHLHYLDAARALFAAGVQRQDGALRSRALRWVRHWQLENPPRGSEGWEPYPVCVRLENLVTIAVLSPEPLPSWFLALVAQHARYVERFPEVHLQGNHLWENGCALWMAGLAFEAAEARRWREVGERWVQREIGQQLLEDGGHFERSAMYHALLLKSLVRVAEIARRRGAMPVFLANAIGRMAGFLRQVLHPDGELPLFNDAVLGQAPAPRALIGRSFPDGAPAASLELRIHGPGAYGLIRVRPTEREALFFDVGPLGPPHQPGHAHSDTLSFELSVDGQRWAVNGGVDGYQSPHRAFFRSAAAHNTVTVDEDGPDELWSSFRVGGRCWVLSQQVQDRGTHLRLSAELIAHQGWRHRRTLLYVPQRALVVLDEVTSAAPVKVCSRVALLPGQGAARFLALLGEPSEGTRLYSPRFNQATAVPERRLSAQGAQTKLAYALVWSGDELSLDAQTVRLGQLQLPL